MNSVFKMKSRSNAGNRLQSRYVWHRSPFKENKYIFPVPYLDYTSGLMAHHIGGSWHPTSGAHGTPHRVLMAPHIGGSWLSTSGAHGTPHRRLTAPLIGGSWLSTSGAHGTPHRRLMASHIGGSWHPTSGVHGIPHRGLMASHIGGQTVFCICCGRITARALYIIKANTHTRGNSVGIRTFPLQSYEDYMGI